MESHNKEVNFEVFEIDVMTDEVTASSNPFKFQTFSVNLAQRNAYGITENSI